MEGNKERSFIMIKPDGVQRNLIAPILSKFEKKGFKLIGMKMVSPSKDHFEKHYEDLQSKKFFNDLITYMLMGPVVAMVWEGKSVVKTGRVIVGATNPFDAAPGTIRGDYCIETGRNIIHASDTVENAEKEIKLWFNDNEIHTYVKGSDKWIYE